MFDKLFAFYLLVAAGILFLLSGEDSGGQQEQDTSEAPRIYRVSCLHPQGWKTYKTRSDLSLVRGFNFETIDGLKVHASVCLTEVD